jgi:hypothetical protein
MQTPVSSAERMLRIRKIEALPAGLRAAIHGLSDSQLDTPYRDGGWTVRQVVHHLADSHMHAYVRMKLILAEDRPTLKTYNQDVWARMPDGHDLPVAPSLRLLEGLHERWTAMLLQVRDEEWLRAAVHPERGEITLESMLQTYAGHGEKHVAQITGLRRARGW